MRICSKCGAHYEHYGQRCSMCRDCKRVYDKEYHRARSDTAKKNKSIAQKLRIREIGKSVNDYLLEHPCEICGESDPVVLEFDHIDRTTKVGNVSDMIKRGLSQDKVFTEIRKCRVLCANCHRRHTASQLGWHICGV